jgi:aspartate-semialdehyde dehydrogenase
MADNKQERNIMGYKVAIVGATSLVGSEIINILAEPESLSVDALYALTSKKQSGREMSFGDKDIQTQDQDAFDFTSVDIVFYTTEYQPSKDIIKKALKAGVKVIDCTGLTLFDEKQSHLFSMPSSRGQQLLSALRPLMKYTKIKRVCVSTFEATSGIGKDGMDELFNQSRKFFVTDGLENLVFNKQIVFNTIPQIDEFMDDGQTKSEWLLNAEIKRFLDKDIKVSATCVQVPVFIGHGMAVNVECEGNIDAKIAMDLWRADNDTTVIDRASEMEYVTPIEIAGEDSVFISRIREDSTLDNGLSFWCAADNVRATMAVKAVKQADKMLAS